MAYIRYFNLWENVFFNNVSPKYKVQDIYLNQLKLKVDKTSKKDEKNNKI